LGDPKKALCRHRAFSVAINPFAFATQPWSCLERIGTGRQRTAGINNRKQDGRRFASTRLERHACLNLGVPIGIDQRAGRRQLGDLAAAHGPPVSLVGSADRFKYAQAFALGSELNWVKTEDLLMQLAKLSSWFGAKLFHEQAANVLVSRESLGRATVTV